MKLSHVCLKTKNLTSLAGFYEKKMGFTPIHRFISSKGETYGYFFKTTQGSFLEILKCQLPTKRSQGKIDHICFAVKNLKNYHKKMQKFSGLTPIQRGKTDKVRRFQVHDPDGNVIEFHSFDRHCVQYQHR